MTKLYTNECLYKDVYTIIEMMNPEMRMKINNKFIDFLKENQNVEFQGTINRNIPIKNQSLREEIKIMLSLMYISYFCTEEKKREILILEEYNVNNFYNKELFKNKQKENEKGIENNQALVEYKESIFRKIINKIKKFFNKT